MQNTETLLSPTFGDLKKADIHFLVYHDGLGAVFGSLYVKPAQLLSKRGYRIRVVNLAPLGEYVRPHLAKRWRARKAHYEKSLPGRISRFPSSPSRLDGIWNDMWSVGAYLCGRDRKGITILDCGGVNAAYFALRARQYFGMDDVKIVFHSWGPIAEEATYRIAGDENAPLNGKDADRVAILRARETYAYRNSNFVVCISDTMRHFAEESLQVPRQRLMTIPCLVDWNLFSKGIPTRAAIRKKLIISDRFVIAFSGTLHRWQKPEAILELFKIIRAIEPKAFLLGLTFESAKLESLLRSRGIPDDDFQILTVEYDQVPEYLAASDIALLGRGIFEKSSKVNLFSSPIKFGEYLAAGCPVILSEGIGDLSGIARSEGLGLVLPENAAPKAIRGMLKSFIENYKESENKFRERCTDFAKDNLDLETNLSLYESAYIKALNAARQYL